jgi:NitT/TauT family transport system substrate-binding protein
MTAAALNLPFDQIRLVPLQSIPNMVSALKGGRVDGALIPATVAVPIIDAGEAKLLGWVGDRIAFQVNGVFAGAKLVAERRDAVARFVRAYQTGTRLFHDAFLLKDASGKVVGGPTRDEMVAAIAKHTGQRPEQILRGIPFIDREARLLVDDVRRQVSWYQEQGVVDRTVDPDAFLDLGFVDGHLGVTR